MFLFSMKEFFGRLFLRCRIWYYTLRPTYALMIGYILYTVVIFTLLSLPICWNVINVPWVDLLFTAVAAVSTAGLQSVNFAETYNILGQVIILIGLHMGGLGYMTLGSLVIMASRGHLPRNRINIGKAVLAMPASFEPQRFFRHILIFTLSIELVGTVFLWYFFWAAGTPNPLWAAIFHSASAFCTAGISIFPNNLESFADNTGICLVISSLCLLGGIGFIVLEDLYRSFKAKHLRTTLTTRIILVATFSALVAGMLFFFFDPNVAEFSPKKRFLSALFQAVAALTTAGFNTIPISNLSMGSIVIIIILISLGASPSGTGGGLKTTTWSAAIAAILSFFRGREEITFFGNKVPHGRIIAAFAAISLYLMTFATGLYCLSLCESHSFEHVVLEVAAALGTSGLSYSITPELSSGGKMIIMVLMFVGRLGVVFLALGAVALYHDILSESGDSGSAPPPVEEDDIVL